MFPRVFGYTCGFPDYYKCIFHFMPVFGIQFPLADSLLLPSAIQRSFLHQGGVSGCSQDRNPRLCFGELSALDNRLFHLNSSLGVLVLDCVLLIIVLKPGSHTDCELGKPKDLFRAGGEADLTEIYPG